MHGLTDRLLTRRSEFGKLLLYKANGVFFEGMLEALRDDGFTVQQ